MLYWSLQILKFCRLHPWVVFNFRNFSGKFTEIDFLIRQLLEFICHLRKTGSFRRIDWIRSINHFRLNDKHSTFQDHYFNFVWNFEISSTTPLSGFQFGGSIQNSPKFIFYIRWCPELSVIFEKLDHFGVSTRFSQSTKFSKTMKSTWVTDFSSWF